MDGGEDGGAPQWGTDDGALREMRRDVVVGRNEHILMECHALFPRVLDCCHRVAVVFYDAQQRGIFKGDSITLFLR